MWIYDRETLRFLEVNEAAISLYEYSRREFLRMTILDIRPAEDIPKLLSTSMRPAQRHESNAEHWRHATKGGTVIDVEVSSWEYCLKSVLLNLCRSDTGSNRRNCCKIAISLIDLGFRRTNGATLC